METRTTNEIKVVSNPRKDFGDMEGLKASIKQEGILQPLLINMQGELIAGERRLRAAIELELEEVPVIVMECDENDKALQERVKLVENLQRKDLTPIEEANAFESLMKLDGKTEEQMAVMLGKTEGYVTRRLTLLKLVPAVQDALNKHKIEIGHAVLLARMGKKEQKENLGYILDQGMRVPDLEQFIEDGTCREISDAMFDSKCCEGCMHNGNEQTLLFDTKEATKGKCLNPPCFIKKTNEWVEKEIENLRGKGINVLTLAEVEDMPGARELMAWDDEYKKAVKNLEKKPDTYAVVFAEAGYKHQIKKQIWLIKKQKKEALATDEEVEQKLGLSNKERLQQKADEFKRELILENTHPDKCDKNKGDSAILTLIGMHLQNNMPHIAKKLKSKKLEAMDAEKLMDRFREYGNALLDEVMELDELECVAELNGFDMKKSFIMTDEFLAMHRKDQLKDLAKEAKIDVEGLDRMDELREAIKKGWKKGRVPKVLGSKK